MLAINDDHRKMLAVGGHRPPLGAITGPADLMSFAKKCIVQCWNESPDSRPSFDGK